MVCPPIMYRWSLTVKARFYFFSSTSLPLSLSLPLSFLSLTLCKGERGRLYRAWQQCSVECRLEIRNTKKIQHPWKHWARLYNGACLFFEGCRCAIVELLLLLHHHFVVLVYKPPTSTWGWLRAFLKLEVKVFNWCWLGILVSSLKVIWKYIFF